MTTSTLLGTSNIFHSTLGNVSFTCFILQLLIHLHAIIRIRRIILLHASKMGPYTCRCRLEVPTGNAYARTRFM